jgi:hypothetical protein
MSFQIKPVNSIKEKVIIQVPKDLGRSKQCDIVVEFKKLPVSEAKKLLEDSASGELNDDEVLHENIIDITGLIDEEGGKLDYTPEILPVLLEMEYARRPIIKKFMEVIVGREAAKAKN